MSKDQRRAQSAATAAPPACGMLTERSLLIGITGNSVVHTDADQFDLETRFRMVRDAGVFDYYERSPPPGELDAHLRLSERYAIPIRAGGFYYTLGRDEALLEWHLHLGHALGAKAQNVQLSYRDAAGVPLTDERVAAEYLRALEIGMKLGVIPCFEVHVNMWSEHYGRIERVADLVERAGMLFNITLDASHVIFKIDNPREQAVQGMRDDVLSGQIVLDPFDSRSVTERWINRDLVGHAHARPAAPNNPINIWGKHPDGKPGRGIQYPFQRPPEGTWHCAWDENALLPWKQVMLSLLNFHAARGSREALHISTEIIPFADYGAGARYSLFADSVACASWLRSSWHAARAAWAILESHAVNH